MDGPRDERDFKAELEIKTPAWLPGIRIATSYQRQWKKRSADYANKAVEFAGIDPDELQQQLSEGGPIADLFLEGGRRVVENGDEVLRDAVTRLVAAALRDDALIHDASYLMKKLSTCEALHIRAICALPHPKSLSRPAQTEYWYREAHTFSTNSIAETCRASNSLVRAALIELTSSGFVEELEYVREYLLTMKSHDMLSRGGYFYKLSELGVDFRDLILKIDATENRP